MNSSFAGVFLVFLQPIKTVLLLQIQPRNRLNFIKKRDKKQLFFFPLYLSVLQHVRSVNIECVKEFCSDLPRKLVNDDQVVLSRNFAHLENNFFLTTTDDAKFLSTILQQNLKRS